MLNKTSPIGQSGHVWLAMSIQKFGTRGYLNWNYPTEDNYMVRSKTDTVETPEIIEVTGERLSKECGISNSCLLIFQVYGQSNITTRYRLRTFKGTNLLHEDKAVSDELVPGEWKYYWFISTGAIFQRITLQEWKHEIGLGIKTPGADVDLYVSVFDGRYPTENDYDFKSTNMGADSVILSS